MTDCDCVPGHRCDCWDYRADGLTRETLMSDSLAREEAVEKALLFTFQLSNKDYRKMQTAMSEVAFIRALEQDGYTVAPTDRDGLVEALRRIAGSERPLSKRESGECSGMRRLRNIAHAALVTKPGDLPAPDLCGFVMARCQNEAHHPGDHWHPAIAQSATPQAPQPPGWDVEVREWTPTPPALDVAVMERALEWLGPSTVDYHVSEWNRGNGARILASNLVTAYYAALAEQPSDSEP